MGWNSGKEADKIFFIYTSFVSVSSVKPHPFAAEGVKTKASNHWFAINREDLNSARTRVKNAQVFPSFTVTTDHQKNPPRLVSETTNKTDRQARICCLSFCPICLSKLIYKMGLLPVVNGVK